MLQCDEQWIQLCRWPGEIPWRTGYALWFSPLTSAEFRWLRHLNKAVFQPLPSPLIHARIWPNSLSVAGRMASATLQIVFRTSPDVSCEGRVSNMVPYTLSSPNWTRGCLSNSWESDRGPPYPKPPIANDAERMLPSDSSWRISTALSLMSTSPCPCFICTLRVINVSASSFTKLFISRLTLLYLGTLRRRLFEIRGVSRLERNTLTVPISISPTPHPSNSSHKLSWCPPMPSMRMHTGSVSQSWIAFLRTPHEDIGLVKNLFPCFPNSTLQTSKSLPSCSRMLYSRSLAI